MKHNDYKPQKTETYGDDLVIYPVDGYGNAEMIRSLIRLQKPDILWFMTDPRFYGWLWEVENEIRAAVPMVYYHVWDNYPYPKFNKVWYDSSDVVVTISKVTDDIVKTISPDLDVRYIPHAVNTDIFKNTLHLDCCFQPIGKYKAIICPDAFVNKSDVDYLINYFGKKNMYIAYEQEAYMLISNLLVLSPEVIVSDKRFKNMNTWLENNGFLVEKISYQNVSKMSGLFRCSTLPLLRE